jgi:hypothetical protein
MFITTLKMRLLSSTLRNKSSLSYLKEFILRKNIFLRFFKGFLKPIQTRASYLRVEPIDKERASCIGICVKPYRPLYIYL